MSTDLYFVRHGQTQANRSFKFSGRVDLSLTDHGINQAYACRSTISKLRPTAIYCSPLLRARQTADIATKGIIICPKIIIDERLIERSFGSVDGKFAPFAMRRVWNYDSSFLKSRYGEETLLTLELRVQDFLDAIRARHPNQTVLVFSHGGVATTIDVILNEGALRSGYFFKDFHLKNGAIAHFAL